MSEMIEIRKELHSKNVELEEGKVEFVKLKKSND